MSASQQLFRLVKSMSKSEKRYFKLFANRHTIKGKNNGLLLFDAIEQQSEYDEEVLLKKFQNSKIGQNLSVVKVQLTTMILKSLRQFRGNQKKKYDVRTLLDYADILFEKGLYEHSLKVLGKARKIAQEYDLLIAMDEISVLEHEIALKTSDYDQLQNLINTSYPELQSIRSFNNKLADYEHLIARMRALSVKSRTIGSSLDQAELDEIMQNDLLSQGEPEDHQHAKIYYHQIWTRYHMLKPDRNEAYRHQKEVMRLFNESIHQVLDSPRWWIQNARILLILLGGFKMYKEFDEAMEEMHAFIETIPDNRKTINLKSEIYTTIYSTKLDIDIDRGLFETAAIFAQKVEKGIEEFRYQINPGSEIVLNYNMFYVYFGTDSFRKALHWLNRVLNHNYRDVRIDIQCHSRLVNLLVHYELGNHELLPGLIRSANRFLNRHQRRSHYESAFLKFVKGYLLEPNNPEFKKGAQEALTEFREIIKDPAEAGGLEYFDFVCWLRSKTGEGSMASLMRIKAEAK